MNSKTFTGAPRMQIYKSKVFFLILVLTVSTQPSLECQVIEKKIVGSDDLQSEPASKNVSREQLIQTLRPHFRKRTSKLLTEIEEENRFDILNNGHVTFDNTDLGNLHALILGLYNSKSCPNTDEIRSIEVLQNLGLSRFIPK